VDQERPDPGQMGQDTPGSLAILPGQAPGLRSRHRILCQPGRARDHQEAQILQPVHSHSVSCVDWRRRHRAMTPPTTNQPVLVYTCVYLSWVDHQRVHTKYRDIQWTGCCLRGVQLQRISSAQYSKLLFAIRNHSGRCNLYGTGRSYRYTRDRAFVLVSGMDSDCSRRIRNNSSIKTNQLIEQRRFARVWGTNE
jgi:hypothetical protein